ncbi:hypothetical protein [Herbaspirillum rhizosphaerae]|uniref:hypothetical protein n=1 Tax=Herbaspirillum rhizosphaerae TaxID=346179 RepID=UPI00067D80CF|nr:hypothetical protein [Herbaspirillum rhizosphaerae]
MENYEYFGIPETNLQAARHFKKKQKKHNFNVDVPSRKEVATLGPQEIRKLMVAWMCDSVTEIIPSRSQIAEARLILLAREDAASLSGLIEMCDHYIRGE